MARTAITPVQLTSDSGVTKGAGASVDATNGMTIADPGPYKVILEVSNSLTTSKNVIVRAGTSSSGSVSDTVYSQQTKGDLTVAVAASSTVVIELDETDRFVQSDGSLSIDFDASSSGTIWALRRAYNTV